MQLLDLTPRQEAFIAIMALPDPPELEGKRDSRVIYDTPRWDRDLMAQRMVLSWLAWQEHEKEECNDYRSH